jgi:hypothetical protein
MVPEPAECGGFLYVTVCAVCQNERLAENMARLHKYNARDAEITRRHVETTADERKTSRTTVERAIERLQACGAKPKKCRRGGR